MTLQLCTFAQSKALKAAGFNWDTQRAFNKHGLSVFYSKGMSYPVVPDSWLLRPTIADAIHWFRIEKGIHGWVESTFYLEDFSYVSLIEQAYKARERIYLIDDKIIYSHDDAENALLNRLIELTAKQD